MVKIFIWCEEVENWVCAGYADEDDAEAFTNIGCVVIYPNGRGTGFISAKKLAPAWLTIWGLKCLGKNHARKKCSAGAGRWLTKL
ncbi:MAG: hypothetical protein HQK58_13030 [Deltaproteobacteria bacterium]|nr:hypothetical protein [Deltaproteobacteria bacterium]